MDILPVIVSILILLVLLVASALISGSEVAFFSLKPAEIEALEKEKAKFAKTTLALLNRPKDLLATILIANNFINVSIIIISTYLSSQFLEEGAMKLFIDIVAITFTLLLFGEVIPKVYATKHGSKMTKLMSIPLKKIGSVFPISLLRKGLVSGTSIINNLTKKKSINVSSDDLEHAIKLTNEESVGNDKNKILDGIVKFGSKDVKQIMKARTDVAAFDISIPYSELYSSIVKNGFSRVPIFKDSFDNVAGILFIKDLIPHIDEDDTFDWTTLIRKPFFVPESKMIDDLLKNFQEKKMHMAVVVDEFGGTSGVVTLEDVLEEIVGDISDEFDVDEIIYSKLDENNYVFEGKTPLVDFYKVLKIGGDIFEDSKGESDTLAGFIIEQAGKILLKNEQVEFENYKFIVEAADKRKVKRIKVIIESNQKTDEA
jgi:gliding motility-associated protein GldE